MGVIKDLERDDSLQVGQEVGKSVCQHGDASIKPIGQHHRQKRCDAAPQGKRAEVTLDEPIDGNEPQQSGKDQRCH